MSLSDSSRNGSRQPSEDWVRQATPAHRQPFMTDPMNEALQGTIVERYPITDEDVMMKLRLLRRTLPYCSAACSSLPTPGRPKTETTHDHGPRAGCEKCQLGVKGHWMHLSFKSIPSSIYAKADERSSGDDESDKEDAEDEGLDALNAHDVVYSIRRLIRGFQARERAVVWLCVALTEILSLILDNSKPPTSATGQEERDSLFARLFGLTSVIQSRLLVNTKALSASASSTTAISDIGTFNEESSHEDDENEGSKSVAGGWKPQFTLLGRPSSTASLPQRVQLHLYPSRNSSESSLMNLFLPQIRHRSVNTGDSGLPSGFAALRWDYSIDAVHQELHEDVD
ncbi:DNA-directed DNA polymerase [Salix suchowensis]|nr:DNA-directed DNA polymerase [Salix suchowensis]